MSTTLVSQYSQLYDFDITNVQNRLNKNTEHLAVGAPVNNFSQNRNLPMGTFGNGSAFVPVTSNSGYSSNIVPPSTLNIMSATESHLNTQVHRKLEHSWSEPCDKSMRNTAVAANTSATVNSTRYKTELCRPFEENGHCKYGDKCQFAHGKHELQNLARHPKYKTDLCRTFHTIGFCPYGPRCHFIHSEEERKQNLLKQQQAMQMQHPGVIQPPQPIQRPSSIKFTSLSSLGSSLDSPSSSVNASPTTLSPSFSGDDIFSSANMANFSPNQQSVSSGSSRSSPVFSSAAELDWMTPLKVQTQMNNANLTDMSALQNQFNSSLNFNTQRSVYENNNINHNVFDDSFLTQVFRESQTFNDAAPSSSPVESVSGLSVGSSSSSSGSGFGTCNSPMEVSRGMRLPIFNRLSQEL
ncbi:hypothetical protein SNE40_008787 [Patella caerulea]|uniref:C3H1-type domain-containing protein n=1 Tax=Patella caerulea TaxID=87958 RepID=A0AAN8JQP5_PATCE